MINAVDLGKMSLTDGHGVPSGVREGYRDGLLRAPFSALYDLHSELWQRNYENARVLVANLRLAGVKPPYWPADLAVCPFGMRAAVDASLAKVGPAILSMGRVQPPDPTLRFTRVLDRRGLPLPVPTVVGT